MQATRRRDSALRDAMNRVNQKLSTHNSTETINKTISEEIATLTQASQVMIFELSIDSTKEIQLTSHIDTQNQTTHQCYSSLQSINYPLYQAIHNTIQKRMPSVLQQKELDALRGLYIPTLLQHMLLIPLSRGHYTYGVLCLCSEAPTPPFDINLCQRLWPITVLLSSKRIHTLHTPNTTLNNHRRLDSNTNLDELYLKIEKNINTAIIEINANHKITRFNQAAEAIFGYAANTVMNDNITKIIPETFPNEHKIHTFNRILLLQQQSLRSKLFGKHAGGSTVPINLKIIQYERNSQSMSLLMIEDLTEIHIIREQQRKQVQRFKAVADLAPVGILQTNANWEAIYVNSRWCEICKIAENNALGLNWISAFHHDDVATALEDLRSAIHNGLEFTGECRFYSQLGDIIWVELLARPIINSKGETDGFLATLADCTYRHITEEKLRIIAERDGLTNLANRSLFMERLNHALQKTQRHGSLALLCLDLDGFKTINDTLGHDAGDRLLQAVARRLESCVRQEDTVARLGGDEFSILLEFITSPTTASEIAEKVLRVLERPFVLQSQEVFISTSIGITFSTVGATENDSKTILKQADIALYRAKAVGRNNYQYFSPELEFASQQRMYVGNSLHRALEREEFEVFYQLQADIKTQNIVGSEALLRWNHPQKGLLSPKEFIDILEETGLILPVSRWLWAQAFPQHQRWIQQGLITSKGHISINLSQRQLREEHLAEYLLTEVTQAKLKPSQVLVEITETALIEDSPLTMQILGELRSAGVQIALDDFGTGFSSLTYLKKFPIHYIKIDQSFIRDLLTDKDDAAITHAVVNLAHTLELTVIAEGVDDLAKRQQLAAWGCDQFQGYILNCPSNSENVQKLLENHLHDKQNAS